MQPNPEDVPPTPAKGIPSTNGHQPSSSRPRFEQYRQKVRQRALPPGGFHSSEDPRPARGRARSARELVWQFVRLLGPFRGQMIWVLASATVATLIGLIPPAGTKFVIDYGLNGEPIPQV